MIVFMGAYLTCRWKKCARPTSQQPSRRFLIWIDLVLQSYVVHVASKRTQSMVQLRCMGLLLCWLPEVWVSHSLTQRYASMPEAPSKATPNKGQGLKTAACYHLLLPATGRYWESAKCIPFVHCSRLTFVCFRRIALRNCIVVRSPTNGPFFFAAIRWRQFVLPWQTCKVHVRGYLASFVRGQELSREWATELLSLHTTSSRSVAMDEMIRYSISIDQA